MQGWILIVAGVAAIAAARAPAPAIPDQVLRNYQRWHDVGWPPHAIYGAPKPVTA